MGCGNLLFEPPSGNQRLQTLGLSIGRQHGACRMNALKQKIVVGRVGVKFAQKDRGWRVAERFFADCCF